MAEKRRLPPRTRGESATKRRISEVAPEVTTPVSKATTRSTPRTAPARAQAKSTASKATPSKREPTPPPPVEETPVPEVKEIILPTNVKDGQPFPLLPSPQASDLNEKEYQSVAESAILLSSYQRSQAKWILDGMFERYWTKPSKKKGKAEVVNPAANTMSKLGTCTIAIAPHTFEATLYTIKDPQAAQHVQHAAPKQSKKAQAQQKPLLQYNPMGTFHQYQSPGHAGPPAPPANRAYPYAQHPPASSPVPGAPRPPHMKPQPQMAPQPPQPPQPIPRMTAPQQAPQYHAPPPPPPNQAQTGPIPAPGTTPRPSSSSQAPQPSASVAVAPRPGISSAQQPSNQSASSQALPPPPPPAPPHPPANQTQSSASSPAQGPPAPNVPTAPQHSAPPSAPPRPMAQMPTQPQAGQVAPVQSGMQPQSQVPKPVPKPVDPVIQMLASRAASNPELKALMKIVAASQANQQQLREFQNHIDELNAIIAAQNAARQKNEQNPLNRNSPQTMPAGPPHSQHNQQRTSTPSTPTPQNWGQKGWQQYPTPQSRPTNNTVNQNFARPPNQPQQQPFYNQPTPQYRPPPPPPPPKPEIKGVCMEFQTPVLNDKTRPSGDRYWLPRNSIIEVVPPKPLPPPVPGQAPAKVPLGTVIVSFLIVRSGALAPATSNETEPILDKTKDYYQPITLEIRATAKIIETLERAVLPQAEVERYMEDIFDEKERVTNLYLPYRLPRFKALNERADGEENTEGARKNEGGSRRKSMAAGTGDARGTPVPVKIEDEDEDDSLLEDYDMPDTLAPLSWTR